MVGDRLIESPNNICMTKIDSIVHQSLTEFAKEIFEIKWIVKEREAVSLYAFGCLLKQCQPDGILYDPRQIGIEVRVLKTKIDKKPEVCKDLIIWPKPGLTCWAHTSNNQPISPLAILEWKAKLKWGINEPDLFPYDVQWLQAFTKDNLECVGYAITLDLSTQRFKLKCARIQGQVMDVKWLVIPN